MWGLELSARCAMISAAVWPVILLAAGVPRIAFRFVRPAPPDTIVITSGVEGSTFSVAAEKYKKTLARNGVKLEILPSEGALDNLKRLADRAIKVDVGFVQGGLAAGETADLVSLGSVFYAPLAVFYRSRAPVERLTQFEGRRIAIGREGSGARYLNLLLLKANGIEPKGPTRLLDLAGADAAQALLEQGIAG